MSTDCNIPDHDSQLTSIYERDMARSVGEEHEDEEADDSCLEEDFEKE